AQVHVSGLDPRAFAPQAPSADLEIRADLAPLAGQVPPDLTQLAVTGPVSVTNGKPGPIDRDLLPLERLNADALLDASRQALSNLDIRLSGGGRLTGSARVEDATRGGLTLEASGLDL